MAIHLTLPYPPSTNEYYRAFTDRKGRQRVLLSAEGRVYKESCAWAWAFSGQERIEGEVVVSLWVFRPQRSGDLDNRIKPVLDAIKEKAFADDNMVVEIHAYRGDDKSNPRVEVVVERYEDDDNA